MIRKDHLEIYDLFLTAKAPVHIGSGKSRTKKDYIFSPSSSLGKSKVAIPDDARLFSYLVEHGHVDKYESFMLGSQTDLYLFLSRELMLSDTEIMGLCKYSLAVADALDAAHSLKEIHSFVRDAQGRAYIPGSSVKGALRTAILTALILNENERSRLDFDPRKGFPEAKYLHSLSLSRSPDNAVNSIMRGISISDSLPVPDSAMMLAGKTDSDINGRTHSINLCRECVKPGTTVHFKLTLDKSVVKDSITRDSIMDAVMNFSAFYQDAWLRLFDPPRGCADVSYGKTLLLGGGAGYTTKTVIYPYLNEDATLKEVSAILDRAFRKANHGNDVSLGASPRVAKYAKYEGKLYPYGLCEVKLL